MFTGVGLPPAPFGVATIQKFGENADIDTAAVEDVWTAGGLYSWPTSAAATTIVSTDAADASGGTGARTVTVFGLDADYLMASETVTMNGVTPVALSTQYLRVFRAYVATAGSGETNAGTISVKHGGTVIAEIAIGEGQTLMALYTVPADYEKAFVLGFFASIGRQSLASYARVALQIREFGGAWHTIQSQYLSATGSSYYPRVFLVKVQLAVKTDIRVRVTEVSANDTNVTAQFDLVQYLKG